MTPTAAAPGSGEPEKPDFLALQAFRAGACGSIMASHARVIGERMDFLEAERERLLGLCEEAAVRASGWYHDRLCHSGRAVGCDCVGGGLKARLLSVRGYPIPTDFDKAKGVDERLAALRAARGGEG